MKVKTLIACAFTATALPLASGWATEPTGPQGIDRPGPNRLTFEQLDTNRDGMISREEYAAAQTQMRGDRRQRGAYDGPSWQTNPPVPPA